MKQELYLLATDKINGIIPSMIKLVLWILSLIYGCFVRLITFCYQKNIFKIGRLDCEVISVGNITLGGTGKTPLVDFIARYLQTRGLKVGILSRGYKRHKDKTEVSGYKSMGDEPSMLLLNNPGIHIAVGRDRISIGRQLVERCGLEVVLLDDGFQHWRLHRNLDIVLIDAGNPFGNRHLLPRGILREPLSSLKRADIFVITKSDAGDADLKQINDLLKSINPDALLVESLYEPAYFYDIRQIELKEERKKITASDIGEKDICLLCSIANPKYFQQLLMCSGFNPSIKFCFLDHHEYKSQDLATVFEACLNKNIKTIITTEKDAVRLKELDIASGQDCEILVLKIEFKITKNEDGFLDRLSSIYKR